MSLWFLKFDVVVLTPPMECDAAYVYYTRFRRRITENLPSRTCLSELPASQEVIRHEGPHEAELVRVFLPVRGQGTSRMQVFTESKALQTGAS